MTLSARETDKVWFDAILKSKHARYIDGVRVIAKDLVAGDELPPGTIMGKEDNEEHYGPVTRGEVDTVNTGEDRFEMEDAADLWNFQVGDAVKALDEDFNEITPNTEDDLEIESIDTDNNYIVVKNIEGTVSYSGAEYLQKDDGTSEAVFVCLQHIDLREEDQLVGGILHGAVYKDRLANYDEEVAEDLPMIAFE